MFLFDQLFSSAVYFSRGTLPTKKGVRRALLGDLANFRCLPYLSTCQGSFRGGYPRITKKPVPKARTKTPSRHMAIQCPKALGEDTADFAGARGPAEAGGNKTCGSYFARRPTKWWLSFWLPLKTSQVGCPKRPPHLTRGGPPPDEC